MTNRRTEYKLEVKIAIQEWEISYSLMHTGEPIDISDVQNEGAYLYFVNENGDRLPVRRVEERWRNQNGLSVEETKTLGAMDFMHLMGVLGEMHKAIEAIK